MTKQPEVEKAVEELAKLVSPRCKCERDFDGALTDQCPYCLLKIMVKKEAPAIITTAILTTLLATEASRVREREVETLKDIQRDVVDAKEPFCECPDDFFGSINPAKQCTTCRALSEAWNIVQQAITPTREEGGK
ncbi:hypothetical protein LCGC14_1736660 [marine sediment metagenome]|uniref:Uncharacterized protein n=1 Tax=marine sediment metagenome TaxID=412755 RepID=A0A0F9K7K7_9ZZZZ